MNMLSDSNQRAGEQFRSNPDRYFHVMTQGWYVFTREGIRGPFIDRNQAETFVYDLMGNRHEEDPSAGWRM